MLCKRSFLLQVLSDDERQMHRACALTQNVCMLCNCSALVQVLSDDEKRPLYDRFGEAGVKGAGGPGMVSAE